MFKKLGLTTLAVFSAAAAIAGSVAYVAPISPEIVEEQSGSMGGSGLWLIPLLAIALIFLAVRGSSTTPNGSP